MDSIPGADAGARAAGIEFTAALHRPLFGFSPQSRAHASTGGPAVAAEDRPQLEPDRLAALEQSLAYRFRNPDLLFHALVHSSARDEGLLCNERMEFLGDSVLGMVISDYLYDNFVEFEEGDLSGIKSVVVSCESLAEEGKRLGLGEFIRLGKGIAQKRAIPDSVLGNTFEAIVAAIYKDGGVEPAREFILRVLARRVDDVRHGRHSKNYKSILQHYTQKELSTVPLYRVTRESGPDHEKSFEVIVELSGKEYGPGIGRTKKDAEQQAARLALELLSLLGSGSATGGGETADHLRL
ncbi:MAG: ribonuclease III [Planctomycetes bacterium]|nr:ribonuclease III [Planctomycetota bacterium]